MSGQETENFELILYRLNQLDERVEKLDDSVMLMRLDIVGLKVRSGVWGGLSGLVTSGLGVALLIFGTGGAAGAS